MNEILSKQEVVDLFAKVLKATNSGKLKWEQVPDSDSYRAVIDNMVFYSLESKVSGAAVFTVDLLDGAELGRIAAHTDLPAVETLRHSVKRQVADAENLLKRINSRLDEMLGDR